MKSKLSRHSTNGNLAWRMPRLIARRSLSKSRSSARRSRRRGKSLQRTVAPPCCTHAGWWADAGPSSDVRAAPVACRAMCSCGHLGSQQTQVVAAWVVCPAARGRCGQLFIPSRGGLRSMRHSTRWRTASKPILPSWRACPTAAMHSGALMVKSAPASTFKMTEFLLELLGITLDDLTMPLTINATNLDMLQ